MANVAGAMNGSIRVSEKGRVKEALGDGNARGHSHGHEGHDCGEDDGKRPLSLPRVLNPKPWLGWV